MMSKKKPCKLSIFLLKGTIIDVEKALKSTAGLERVDVSIGNETASLYYRENHPSTPPWVNFFEHQADKLDRLKNKGIAAVFFVKSKGRLFALTFGYGRALLSSSCYEENFGFRVVLNTVDPDGMRSADAQNLFTIS